MTDHITARCRLPSGAASEIDILDINEAGCLADKQRMRMQAGDRVLIKLPGLEHKAAHVAWVEEHQAGISFEEPLYGPVLQHLLASANDASEA
jgi:hypothetical protein